MNGLKNPLTWLIGGICLMLASCGIFGGFMNAASTTQQLVIQWPTYKAGSASQNIRTLQYFLLYHFTADFAGQQFDPAMAQAIDAFETAMGVQPSASGANPPPVPKLTGQLDPPTVAALKAFQKLEGLPVTGVVDDNTWMKLIVPVSPGDTGYAVMALQSQLLAHAQEVDVSKVSVNGKFDAATEEALKNYQQDGGLPVTHKGDLLTWNRIVGGYVHYEAEDGGTGGSIGPIFTGPMGPIVASIVAAAKSALGTSYVYGGSCANPHSGDLSEHCDCSSLVQMSYLRGAGLHLPRVTYDQARSGVKIPLSQIQAGDLLFPYAQNLGHVGLYIGGGVIIEAPHTGDVVKYQSLRQSYWSDSLIIRPNVLIDALNKTGQHP